MKFNTRVSTVLTAGLLGAIATIGGVGQAKADLLQDFDSLGGNDVLLEKAQALNPEVRVRVVQDRIVQRRNRWEFSPEISSVFGGDAYNSTQNVGLNAHYHITPHWSVGAKYNYSFNQLRTEGEALIAEAKAKDSATIPDIDFPKQQMMAVVNWYPVYGKMNIFDLGVAHFDLYALAGAGQIQLRSGSTGVYSFGGGIGFWISQHLSTRIEVSQQVYKAKRFNGEVGMNTSVAGVQIGYML